jgi:two-component system, chemotaxis family, chemotaxis protein CheY
MEIMLVDDDPDIRRTVRHHLEATGHSVTEAEGGRLAIQKLRRSPVDLVVSDMFMPDGDGLDLLRALRHHRPEIRVIVISSGGTRGVCDMFPAARHLGAHATLRKPLKLTELLAIVERVGEAIRVSSKI